MWGRMLREMGYWNFQGKSSKCFNGLQLYSVELLFLVAPHHSENGLTGTLSLSGLERDMIPTGKLEARRRVPSAYLFSPASSCPSASLHCGGH